ncbi:hypothetical protein PENSUB_740 [Penicillium subrubescens]|uniref:Uncharacterized protein n=1 Tax=Penicillium subrubescens TaxID=1316194 RepID=A0A1Q5UM71_9EURO|nr:hypothetical protein PENSUB_740 [Penicillium subrubescens]
MSQFKDVQGRPPPPPADKRGGQGYIDGTRQARCSLMHSEAPDLVVRPLQTRHGGIKHPGTLVMGIWYWLALNLLVDHYRIAICTKIASPGSILSGPGSVLGPTYSGYVCALGVPVVGDLHGI